MLGRKMYTQQRQQEQHSNSRSIFHGSGSDRGGSGACKHQTKRLHIQISHHSIQADTHPHSCQRRQWSALAPARVVWGHILVHLDALLCGQQLV